VIRAIFLLLLLLLALPAAAQTAIHRCVAADGRPVFSDQPCTSMGATSVMPAPATSTLADLTEGPSTGLLCAKDLAELRQGVAQAFASRSANRIGGLILWNGYGSSGAVDNLRAMELLVRQPLVGLEGSAEGGIDAVTSAPGGDGSTRRAHFGVVRDSGCLWLRPPG
jgi:hypothetical protein